MDYTLVTCRLQFSPKLVKNSEKRPRSSNLSATSATCTPQILKGLAESYAGGGSMTENIDKVGGEGTGAFAKQVIDIYTQKLL